MRRFEIAAPLFLGILLTGAKAALADSVSFLYAGGVFTTINYPGATDTAVLGINNSGQIVGSFGDSTGEHGFMDAGSFFTVLNYPGAIHTDPYGINDSGQIVGTFYDSTGQHFFVDTGGVFTTLDYPGTISTWASGINDSGQIVGYATYDSLAPEPGFYAVLAISMAGLLFAARRRKSNR